MIASRSRSTTSDAREDVKGSAGVERDRANARAISPTRAGTTLLIIMPMAVARHSFPYGIFGTTGSRIGRQRIARSGNVPVARTAERTISQTFVPRMCVTTSSNLIPRKAKYRKPALSRIPKTPRQPIFMW